MDSVQMLALKTLNWKYLWKVNILSEVNEAFSYALISFLVLNFRVQFSLHSFTWPIFVSFPRFEMDGVQQKHANH